MSAAEAVAEFARAVRATGYRGVAVVGAEPRSFMSLLAGIGDEPGRRLLVTTSSEVESLSGALREEGWDVKGQSEVPRILGYEYDLVAVDGFGHLEANTLAAVAETLRGGGLLVLGLPAPLAECRVGWGVRFCRYLLATVRGSKQHLILEAARGEARVVSRRLMPRRAPARTRPQRVEGLPSWLARLVATYDQAKAVAEIARAVEAEGQAAVMVVGDRGRGKSAAVGLALALLVARRRLGTVPVVAPSPFSVQSLFTHFVKGLRAAGIRWKAWGPNGLYEGVKGAWFKVYLERADEASSAPLVVIDEAAAVGIARLRRISWRARKLIASTTVHGYEGSGRTLLQRLVREIPGLTLVELREPIRYPKGDPLEEWLYNALMLNAEPEEERPVNATTEVRLYRADDLASNPTTLRKLYSILVLAHYRNSPNDLQLLLNSDDILVYALHVGGIPLTVCEVMVGDRLVRDLFERLTGSEPPSPWARVVRIATRPDYQRKGLGSKLLAHVERELASKGVSMVAASFANSEALGFWLKNGYAVVYVSPRFNKVTGEKNIVVAKPLSEAAAEAVALLHADFRTRLAALGSSVYRDMPGEVVARMLASCPPWYRAATPSARLTPLQLRRLKLFLEGREYVEFALDAVKALVEASAVACLPRLGGEELLALVMLAVQGKPVWEVANVLRTSVERVEELVRAAAKTLAELLNVPLRGDS